MSDERKIGFPGLGCPRGWVLSYERGSPVGTIYFDPYPSPIMSRLRWRPSCTDEIRRRNLRLSLDIDFAMTPPLTVKVVQIKYVST